MTQAQLDNLVGNAGTLLPEGNAPDTNASFYVWTCWEQPQLDQVATAAVGDDEGAVLRAQFSCGPGNPRRKTGTPLALDAPYPNGHPLADRP